MDRLPDTVGLGMAMLAAACRPPAPDGPGTQWTLAASTHPESKGRKGKVRWPRCRGGRTAEQLREDTRTHARTHAHAVTHARGHRGFLPGARDTPLSLGCWKRQTSMAGTATCMLSRGQPPSGPPGSRSRQPPVLGPSEKKSSKLPINQTCGL